MWQKRKPYCTMTGNMAEHVYMFAGDSVYVTFHAKKYLVGDIMDWFGRDVKLSAINGDMMKVDVKVNENAMFYWLMQYGEHVEVKQPVSLRERITKAAVALAEKYTKQ